MSELDNALQLHLERAYIVYSKQYSTMMPFAIFCEVFVAGLGYNPHSEVVRDNIDFFINALDNQISLK